MEQSRTPLVLLSELVPKTEVLEQSHITKNWQGQPLIDVQTAIGLIGTTRTATGLTVICVRDDTEYELAKKVSDEDFATITLVKIAPFETWNYRILPQ